MYDLLSDVKKRLRITWEYDNDEISDLIEEAKDWLANRIDGIDFDDTQARKLVKEYCRYAWNGSISSFEYDFKRDILSLQLEYAVKE